MITYLKKIMLPIRFKLMLLSLSSVFLASCGNNLHYTLGLSNPVVVVSPVITLTDYTAGKSLGNGEMFTLSGTCQSAGDVINIPDPGPAGLYIWPASATDGSCTCDVAGNFDCGSATISDFTQGPSNSIVATITGTDGDSSSSSSALPLCDLSTDADCDGVLNTADLDDDNDGILDAAECVVGTDFYFTSSAASTASTAQTYTTAVGSSWTLDPSDSFLLLNSSLVSFQPMTAQIWPAQLNYLEGISQAYGTPALNLTIDDSFPDFANNDAEFLTSGEVSTFSLSVNDPDGGTYSSATNANDFSNLADEGRMVFESTFQIDDLQKYFDIFLEHREYVDGKIELYVNGNLVFDLSGAGSTHTNWEEDPNPTIKSTGLDPSFFNNGTNTLRVVVTEGAAGGGAIGSVGFAAFGRFGALFCDSDSDGRANHVDDDSDGDGCSDALEGGAGFPSVSLTTENNLCLNSSCVDGDGVPTNPGTAQTIGDSQNPGTISCLP